MRLLALLVASLLVCFALAAEPAVKPLVGCFLAEGGVGGSGSAYFKAEVTAVGEVNTTVVDKSGTLTHSVNFPA